jgi:hypothetical protein
VSFTDAEILSRGRFAGLGALFTFCWVQKIISMLLKDLDVFARNSIKDELASLDPLLRNVGGWGGGGLVGTGDEGGRAVDDYDQ